jgi:hypothetical protein
MIYFSALKDVDVNSTEKRYKNTLRLVSLFLCPRGRSLIHRQRE